MVDAIFFLINLQSSCTFLLEGVSIEKIINSYCSRYYCWVCDGPGPCLYRNNDL